MSDVVYTIEFAGGRQISVDTGVLPSTAPDWTRLDFHQCPNCPLQVAQSPHCPMAQRFVPLIELAGALRSYEPVRVRVDCIEREVSKQTTVQRALGSLMGLLAARSACPHTDFLKPMAHFHLPFASEEESLYRAASTYLLAQYFKAQAGELPDWTLAGLAQHYAALQSVNAAMAARLRAAAGDDGAVNAIILLDLLAKAMPYSIDERFDGIAAHFAAGSA